MSWDLASVIITFFVPYSTIFMTHKVLDDPKVPTYSWLKLFVFLFNLFFIGLGLWVGKVIADLNDATVASLLDLAWRSYLYFSSFVFLVIVILVVISLVKQVLERFPSLSEKR